MFYITPPHGRATLLNMENCIFTRLEYLMHLYHNKTEEFEGNSEYLLENTINDQIGHFTLRLLAATSTDLRVYWLIRETLLFKRRLKDLSPRQIHRLFRSIKRNLEANNDNSVMKSTLVKVSEFYLQPKIFSHTFRKGHPDNCEKFCCKVKFELVEDLVRSRKVKLEKGFVKMECSKWKELLVSLFKNYTRQETMSMSCDAKKILSTDSRLDHLNKQVQRQVLREGCGCGKITFDNINQESEKFPPCMRHLHLILREKHRLGHQARFFYTLFLKGSGMKIQDSISYWKEEYSKPHDCTSSCSHEWQKDEKKFLYSIRHMYGLEGGRRNYKSRNCTTICKESMGTRFEGGCPFKDFDESILRKLLVNFAINNEDIEDIVKMKSTKRPEAMCTEYFKKLYQMKDDNFVVSSPLQYYLSAIGSN